MGVFIAESICIWAGRDALVESGIISGIYAELPISESTEIEIPKNLDE